MGSDLERAQRILEGSAGEVTAPYHGEAREIWAQIQRRYPLEDSTTVPLVTLAFDHQWVTFTVRYTVRYDKRRTTRHALSLGILRAIEAGDVARIRFRSLGLVGRTVVVFGLLLAISGQLIGRGTIYRWVFSVCWFAALPIALVIVRLWRNVIFERIDAFRKQTRFKRWVGRSRTGWRSFPAAVLAGVYLFVTGSLRATRDWIFGFDLSRRVLAYLFRRRLDRRAEERAGESLRPLPQALFTALGPETVSAAHVPGIADEQIEGVEQRINRVGGGVFAVVGERGAGKTTILRRVSESLDGVVLVDCPVAGLDVLAANLAAELGLDAAATLEECAAKMNASRGETALLVDNAHRLIQPVMGGLRSFDRLVEVARKNSSQCTWFFAINEVVWRFFERARRPPALRRGRHPRAQRRHLLASHQ